MLWDTRIPVVVHIVIFRPPRTGSALNKNEIKTDLDTCYIGIIIYVLFKSYYIFMTPGWSSKEEDVEMVRMQ